MARFRIAAVLAAALLGAGCLSSQLVLRVKADGSGEATITTRVYLSNLRAYDSMFPTESPRRAPQVEEELPPLTEGGLRAMFGTPVRLVSSHLDGAPDGGIRTTQVAFDDIRRVQLMFPPVSGIPGGHFDLAGVVDPALITFSIRRHDNGDRLLVVTLPDPRMANQTDAPITEFKTNSPEELAFKQSIRNMSLRMFVETEQPLLRTNAPRRENDRATIFDLDLDRIINGMDETRARRMVAPGSFQELLWQIGDLPGAVVPVDRELFLEYQDPDAPQAPAPQPAAQAPPDTEIYLATLTRDGGRIVVGAAANITNNPGYDNQPSFTPDGGSILFTSQRGTTPAVRDNRSAPQTDIYRYDIASHAVARVTQTPESEYSPTVMPDGTRISVVRVEGDGAQRLWSIAPSGAKIQLDVLLPAVKPVGYHAWADDHTLVLFVLGAGGAPATLQVGDTRTGQARVLATDIGRSIQRMPGSGPARHVSFVQRQRAAGGTAALQITELDPATGAMTPLTPAVEGSREADVAWTPDGTLLMAKDDVLYRWHRGEAGWTPVIDLKQLSLHGVTRLAVSPAGDRLALVAQPR
jgi:WD40 repeat protein